MQLFRINTYNTSDTICSSLWYHAKRYGAKKVCVDFALLSLIACRKRPLDDKESYIHQKLQRILNSDNLTVSGMEFRFSMALIETCVESVKFGGGIETNQQRIEVRSKQIQYGKNTIGYDNYLALVPK